MTSRENRQFITDFNNYSPDSLITVNSRENRFSDDSFANPNSVHSSRRFSDDSLEARQAQEENFCDNQDEDDPVGYLYREIYPILIPCFEKMLFEAKENNVLKVQKCRFNGLDYLAELLWNKNPCHPDRQKGYVPVYDIPFVQEYLANKPRPVYPPSWLWTPEEAAVVIQAAVRGYWVRKSPDVLEMRQFWRDLANEKTNS